MVRAALGIAAAALLAAAPGGAADMTVSAPVPDHVVAPPAIVAPAPPPVVTGPLAPPPQVVYGCERIWRCDSIVCEWRRGCWGIYGYVEGPYYTAELARRHWEMHGWPASPRSRRP
jgi:hypothetical protein